MTSTLARGELLVDYAFRHPDPAAIAAAGYRGVVRYLSLDPTKDLSAAERDELFAAGLGIRLVWETTADRATLGHQAGNADATLANQAADALGFPRELALYFAVDEQVAPAAVLAYFAGAKAGSARPVKVYGDAAIVDAAAAQGFGAGWQTAAWSGSEVSSHAELYQRSAPTRSIAGTAGGDYDEDVAVAELEVWAAVAAAPGPAPAPAPPPPPPPAPAPADEGLGIVLRQLQTAQPMMRGGDVRAVQAVLNAKLGTALALDGIFGPATAGAVESWQRARGLTVDGIVGTGQTWPSLIDA